MISYTVKKDVVWRVYNPVYIGPGDSVKQRSMHQLLQFVHWLKELQISKCIYTLPMSYFSESVVKLQRIGEPCEVTTPTLPQPQSADSISQ